MQPAASRSIRPLRGSPPLAVAAGMAVLAGILALGTALQITTLASLDETVYKLSAVRYADGGLGALLSDDVARGSARLYALLIAPLFAAFPGDVAIRAARAATAVTWTLAAIPVYLLARRVTPSRRHAAAAALLAVAVPWATISTVLFTEGLAYPLFAAAALAMAVALRDPTPARDVLVLALLVALVGTRTQFVALPVGWLAAVLVVERGAAGTWRGAAAATWRRRRVLVLAAGLAALGGLIVVVAGGGLRALAGPYAEIQSRQTLPLDVAQATLFEAAMLALGTGLIPAVLAAAWLREALGGRAGDEARRLAVLAAALLVPLAAVTLAATGGWQGPAVTEERYWIYALPFLFVGALAGLDLARVRAATLLWGGLGLALLLTLAPTTAGLSGERAFLVPVAATTTDMAVRVDRRLGDLLGLDRVVSARDLVFVLAIVVAVLAAVGWRRARWVALVPAVALQLFFGGYALATMHGQVPGVAGVTGDADLEWAAWVDRMTDGGADVTLLEDRLDAARGQSLTLAFWNDEVRRTLRVEPLGRPRVPYPVSALPSSAVTLGGDLRVTPPRSPALVVVSEDSPVVQLAGRQAVLGDDGVLLVAERPLRATWTAAIGPNGEIAAPVAVRAAPARATLTFDAPQGTPGGQVKARLGAARGAVSVAGGKRAELQLDACDGTAPVAGTLTPSAGSTARLVAVSLAACR